MRATVPVALLAAQLLADSGGAEVKRAMPVNPKATKEARQLLAFLYDIQGKHTLSGQHNFIATGSRSTDLEVTRGEDSAYRVAPKKAGPK